MTTDLVERLRRFKSREVCVEAADEIERLRQDVSVVHADICSENDNLKAENERLRGENASLKERLGSGCNA